MTQHPDAAGEDPEAVGEDRDALVVDGAFGGGYLIRGGGNAAPSLVDGWPSQHLGQLTYHPHPRTRLHTATREHRPERVVILGTPVDVAAGTADGQAITDRALQTWTEAGLDAAVHHLAYLGGRWTAVLDPGDGAITVVPDCQATQAVFWSTRSGLALGSQPALVAATVGADADAAAEQMMRDLRTARAKGVVFLPGTMTTHEDVLPLVPNHLLHVRMTGGSASVEHRRFWPFEERVERADTAAVTEQFIDYFREHTRLLCSLGRPVVSLTGGKDSRTTLAAALPHLREDSFAFTYYNPRDGLVGEGAPLDVFTASALAAAVGLQHRVLRWRQPAPGSVFAEIYDRTYPVRRGSTGAAHAMWADLPHDIVHLQSIGAELGTTFYTDRQDVPISPQRLLEIVSHRTDLPPGMAHAAFGDYLDYAQFTTDAIGGYDYHDVFYWEQRMGKWGYLKYQDGDFAHRMLMPFNARGLIELMQSLPYRQREEKVLLHALLASAPQLADPDLHPPALTRPALPAPGEAPITWRDLVAARPHLRPRLRRAVARVRGTDAGSMP
ncbi:hypothetical protein MWU75_19485 [Ornithinimicrobium sp. F0845]|uniref:hypothetical protein n=1 Tax=Ornithinimicrobium sp. F0845 TaxID=2926412 RepID=UPI001FF26B86|nr:hypothetical protein [Ornithinimicrobium sp. F0845]MCK0114324.1 hypothetical protein [Ornithinimicrobium sp. F0845]